MSSPRNVEQRLGQLEREVRRWRLVTMAVVLSGAGLTLVGAAKGPGELTATGLTIVDAAGRKRALLFTRADNVLLGLADVQGIVRVGLSVIEGPKSPGKGSKGAGFHLYDTSGRGRASLELLKDDTAALMFYDDSGRITDGVPRSLKRVGETK